MSSRDDLHRLVDHLDDEWLTDADELLRGLQQRRGEPDQDRPLSIIGLFEGEPDLAQRSSEILRRHALHLLRTLAKVRAACHRHEVAKL